MIVIILHPDGIPVRRVDAPGLALLHDQTLTYSFVWAVVIALPLTLKYTQCKYLKMSCTMRDKIEQPIFNGHITYLNQPVIFILKNNTIISKYEQGIITLGC